MDIEPRVAPMGLHIPTFRKLFAHEYNKINHPELVVNEEKILNEIWKDHDIAVAKRIEENANG